MVRACLNKGADLITWLYPHWNPDAAWRYLPIAAALRRSLGPKASVLDVGSGAEGIVPYTSNPCVLTDLCETEKALALFVRARATALPFRDRSFDAVVSVDLLEHMPGAEREAALREFFRVARRMVVVAMPCGTAAEAHDRRLYEEARADNDLRRFLREHIDNGLPSAEEVLRWVRAAAEALMPDYELITMGNANLTARYWMMRGVVRADTWGSIIRLRFWTPLIPLLTRWQRGECYRLIVLCRGKERSQA